MRDLYRWTFDPIPLLRERSAHGDGFTLRLWRRAHIGYSPAWNKAVLTDLDTFISAGSLSSLTPYLRGGVIHLDQPAHNPRRRDLNPHFHTRALAPLADALAATVERQLPEGGFEAATWASAVVRSMLNTALFAGSLPDGLLARFLDPLDRDLPSPLLPRPVLFRRTRAAIAAHLADPGPDSIASWLHHLDDPGTELLVSLAAGYDTTAHTLAWAIWLLGEHPQWQQHDTLPWVIDEVLRLYPAGWLGSRRATSTVNLQGHVIARGAMVCFSPYLTHRDPDLWPQPDTFRPERFAHRPAPWAYVPFAGGPRTCLGMHLAKLMLTTALAALLDRGLSTVDGDPGIRAGITLRPAGPLHVRLRPRTTTASARPARRTTDAH